jgi:hypothetical protein
MNGTPAGARRTNTQLGLRRNPQKKVKKLLPVISDSDDESQRDPPPVVGAGKDKPVVTAAPLTAAIPEPDTS